MSDRWVYDMRDRHEALNTSPRHCAPFRCGSCGGFKWAPRAPMCCGTKWAAHAEQAMDLADPDEAQDDTPALVTW